MITNWLLTGDTHGKVFQRLNTIDVEKYTIEHTAVIILGDASLNYFLTGRDDREKDLVNNLGFRVYCVRGNHEARPQDIPYMKSDYDEDVDGEVYYQERWPNIRYFMDFGNYNIGGYRVLVIGGAYSVDKEFRLLNGYQWFENEMLSPQEMSDCLRMVKGAEYDFVLTHTCPISVEPTDLFLSSIDQSKVDKSMELFLEEVRKSIKFKVHCFGHFHDNRIERPGFEQFYTDYEEMNTIYRRWLNYPETPIDWYLKKSPNYYMEVN